MVFITALDTVWRHFAASDVEEKGELTRCENLLILELEKTHKEKVH